MNLNSSIFDSIRTTSRGRRGGAKQERTETKVVCAHKDCNKPGTHRGPDKANSATDWYCSAHIRKANESFNFFQDMNESDVQTHLKANIHGHRPTRPLNSELPNADATSRLIKEWQRGRWNNQAEFDKSETIENTKRTFTNAPPAVLRALETMGLSRNKASPDDIKSRFRELVKQLHPDSNGNLPHAAEHLRNVIDAHALLRKSGYC